MEQKTQGEEKQWYLLIAQVFTRLKKPISFRSPLTFIIFLSIITVLLLLLGKNFLPPSSVPSQSKPSLFLSLESPIDSQVITDNIMKVKGETLPETTVVVFTEKDITSLKSDANGQFAGAVRLSTGLNTLTVSAFAENGEEQSTILDIIYDNHVNVKGEKTSKDEEKSKEQPPGQEKKQEQPPGQEQQQPPPEQRQEQPAREEPKQEQAPGQVKKEEPPQTAIVGGVERVTSDSVIVEEKQQKKKVEAKVDESTLIKNQDDKTLELHRVKAKDEAAIIPKEEGTQPEEAKEGETQIKEAARIFVRQATPSAQLKRHAIQGVITNIIGNLITVAHQTQTDRNFTFLVDDQTVVKIREETVSTKDLAVGQRVIAVGDLTEEGTLLAKLIHIIENVSSIPTLTPTPTPPPCVFVSAFWNTPVNSVVEGTTVGLGVATKGECAGKQATFEVREYDSPLEGGTNDPVSIQPSPVIFLDGSLSAQTTWVTEWQNDCLGLCNPPEYHFAVSLIGGNTIQSAPPLLSVERKVEPSPTPTPTPKLTPTPTPGATVLSARSLTVYGDDGTKCFDSDGNNQLNEHYFIKGYCQDNSGIYYDSCPDGFDNRMLSEYACYRAWNGTARCNGIRYTCSSCGQCIDGAFQDPSLTSPSLEGPTPTPFSISTYPDTSAPVITRISPAQANLTVSGIVTLEVGATDNVGVTKVDYYVGIYDNRLVHLGTFTEPPYRVLWDTTKYTNNWNHIIYATAYDAQNNSSAIVWYLYVSNP